MKHQINLKYVNAYTSRNQVYFYFRKDGKRIRLPGSPGTKEFDAAYKAALSCGTEKQGVPNQAPPGSFQKLWDEYERSAEAKQLSIETFKDYKRLLAPSLKKYGQHQVAGMDSAWVMAQRAKFSDRPSRANAFMAALKMLLSFGAPRGYRPREGDPAKGIKRLRVGDGHRAWTLEEVETMCDPAKTGRIALVASIGRYTLQRLSDVLEFEWDDYDGKYLRLVQNKTRHTSVKPVYLHIPVHPDLKKILDAEKSKNEKLEKPCKYICSYNGKERWLRTHYGHEFTKIRRKLEMPEDLHFHGLRGTGAIQYAMAGASPHEIAGMTGHNTLYMILHYTRHISQSAVADNALAKVLKLDQKTKKTAGKTDKKNTMQDKSD
jgi:hypothetical protein